VGDLLLVFLKHPRPGAVKTRFIPALGETLAAELYRTLAEEEVRQTAPREGEYVRLFCFAPPEERAAIAAWFPGEDLWPQPAGGLGLRMAAAFAEAFRRGARRAVIVGTDVPWVSREEVGAALSALDGSDVVIGPSRDGGYYLLGLREPHTALFEGIAWSTPLVLAETLARAGTLGLRVYLLETLTDVDTLEDVRLEWPRLRVLLASRPALRRAVAEALGEEGD
jgi:hypothetical protein